MDTKFQVNGYKGSGQWIQRFRSMDTKVQVSGYKGSGQWTQRFRSMDTKVQVNGYKGSGQWIQRFRLRNTKAKVNGRTVWLSRIHRQLIDYYAMFMLVCCLLIHIINYLIYVNLVMTRAVNKITNLRKGTHSEQKDTVHVTNTQITNDEYWK